MTSSGLSSGEAVAGRRFLAMRLIVGTGLTVVTALYLLRTLEPSGWAAFSLAAMAVQLGQDVMYRAHVARLAQARAEPTTETVASAVRRQATTAAVIAGVTLCIGVYEGLALGDRAIPVLMAAAAVTQLSLGLRYVPIALLERRLDFRKVAVLELTETATFCGLVVALSIVTTTTEWLAVAFLARGVVALAMTARLWPAGAGRLRSPEMAAEGDARFGRAMLAVSGLVAATYLVPQVVIAATGTVDRLAEVQTAFLFFTYALVLVQIPMRVDFVLFSHERAAQRRARLASTRLRDLAVLIAPPAVIVMTLAAPMAVLVAGDAWRTSGELIAMLAPAWMLMGVYWPVLLPLALASGNTKIVIRALAVSLAGYLIAAMFLFPLGIAGIAASFSLAVVLLIVPVARGLHRAGLPVEHSTPVLWVVLATCLGTAGGALEQAGLVVPVGLLCIGASAVWLHSLVAGTRRSRSVSPEVAMGPA